ncbi:MAG TPA: ankyrin repeat domain-containing protein, partial [Acidobacteriaceae bacterium]|nr:ankyrin repeat domain-containing protein [Acidobacteriaceae bacterium]
MKEAESSVEANLGSARSVKTTRRSIALVVTGALAVIPTVSLAVRIVWEETFLTIQQGPQMIGYSLAHGFGALLFLGPILLLVWLLAALIAIGASLWRKKSLSRWFWLTLLSAFTALGILSIPPEFWQWTFAGTFSKSPHAADLMVSEAAEGDIRTVRRYLEHGIPLTAKNYAGSTAVFTASAGGSLPVVE